jgi:hypothetical protein
MVVGTRPIGVARTNDDANSNKPDLVARLTGALGVLAASAAILYVLGGIAYALTLRHEHLPPTAIVAQLPREFLLTVTLKVFGFALLTALVVLLLVVVVLGSADSRSWRKIIPWMRKHRRVSVIVAVAAGLLCLATGAFIQTRLGLPSTVACLKDKGTPVFGTYIGQTGDRTYVGEPHVSKGRIASLPNDEVGTVFIGGNIPDDNGVDLCAKYEPATSSSSSKNGGK